MKKRRSGEIKILIAVVVIVLGVLLLRYEYRAYVISKDEFAEAEENLNDEQERLDELKEFAEQYEVLPEQINRLKHVIPLNKDVPEVLTQLQVIAERDEMVFRAIYFDADRGKKSSKNENETDLPADVEAMPIRLSVSGSYENFRRYIEDLEHNIRLVDIENISIQGDEYSLSATVYYLQNNP